MQTLRSALLLPLLALAAATTPLHAEDFAVDASFQRSAFYSDFGRVNYARPDSQGRIYLVGELTGANGQRLGRVIRLLPNGTLDPAFAMGAAMASAQAILVDSSDRVLVLGTISGVTQAPLTLVRFLSDGSVDPTFQPAEASGSQMAETADGKILMLRGASLRRLNADGSDDPTFTNFTLSGAGSFNTLVIDADGKILLGGNFTLPLSAIRGFVRLNANGTIDSTLTPLASVVSFTTIDAIGLQADGKIVLAGPSFRIGLEQYSLIRVNPNGTLDSTFLPTALGSSTSDNPRSIVIQPDDRIVVASNRVVGVHANGGIDPNFTPPATDVALLAFPPHCLARSAATGQVLLATANYLGRVNFTSTGEPIGCVVSLNPDGTRTAGFVPPALDKEVFDVRLTLQGGSRLAWGGFDRVNGTAASPVVRLLETGLADPTFATIAAYPLWQTTNSLGTAATGTVFASFTEDSTNLSSSNARATRLVRLGINGAVEAELPAALAISPATRIHVHADGRLLVNRGATDGQSAVRGVSPLRRLLADGSADPTWAGVQGTFEQLTRNPQTTVLTGLKLGAVQVLAVYPEGRILAVLSRLEDTFYRLVRLLPDGRIDPDFASTAYDVGFKLIAQTITDPIGGTTSFLNVNVPQTLGYDLADIGPDGSIVVAGSLNDPTDNFLQPHLAKLLPNGAADPAFTVGTGPTLANGSVAKIYRVRFAPDGKIWVLGHFDRFNGTAVKGIVRLLANGALDATATFPVGWLDFGAEGADIGFEVDGRVYLTGSYARPGERIPFAVTKLQGTPLMPIPTVTPAPIPPTPTPTPTPAPAYLRNVSTRLFAGSGNSQPIAGFSVSGGAKQVIIRALGPTLATFGVTDVLADPTLELRNVAGNLVASRDNFFDPDGSIAATGLAPSDPLEAALSITLTAGNYTAVVRGKNGTVGNCLIEVYEVAASTPPPIRLVNISTRGLVGTGDRVMIGGFVVGGDTPRRFLVRSLGPSLTAFGVPDVLADPTIQLVNASGGSIALNDDWQTGGQAAEIAATVYAPGNAAESALMVTLGPGSYTAIVRGKNGTTGNAIVEVYELP